jgi:hypothetical protein
VNEFNKERWGVRQNNGFAPGNNLLKQKLQEWPFGK